MMDFLIFVIFISFSSAKNYEIDPNSPLWSLLENNKSKSDSVNITHNIKANPFQVSLQIKPTDENDLATHFCSGSILNSKFILTTGYCVIDKNSSEIQVVAGTGHLMKDHSPADVEIIFIHKSYKKLDFDILNDIAILKLKKPLSNDITFPLKIAKVPYHFFLSQSATLQGWGYLSSKGFVSSQIQEANLKIPHKLHCSNVYTQQSIRKNQICAHFETDFCNVDRGAPLIYNGQAVGIFSWGVMNETIGCINARYPSIFVNIANYQDWIIRISKNHFDNDKYFIG